MKGNTHQSEPSSAIEEPSHLPLSLSEPPINHQTTNHHVTSSAYLRLPMSRPRTRQQDLAPAIPMQAHEWCVGSQAPTRSNITNSLCSAGLLSSLHRWKRSWLKELIFLCATLRWRMFREGSFSMAFTKLCVAWTILIRANGPSNSYPFSIVMTFWMVNICFF